jgi:protein TonB
MLPKLAPKPTPKAVDRKVAPAPTPAPTPTPVAAAPSPIAPATPGQTTPTAAPAAAPTVAESAPARPTLGISTPKGVTKLECGIVRPDYPSASRRRGETGTVVVNFVLGVDGKVERANIKKSSGYDRLDDAARTAVLDSSCKPYVENGQPIRVTKDQPFVFNLDE